jgi:hypothetical protein
VIFYLQHVGRIVDGHDQVVQLGQPRLEVVQQIGHLVRLLFALIEAFSQLLDGLQLILYFDLVEVTHSICFLDHLCFLNKRESLFLLLLLNRKLRKNEIIFK